MKNFNQKRIVHTSRAFTLIETLIALSVFSVTLVVFMTVMSKNLGDIESSKNKIIATYLAYEGVELVRDIRDTFVLYSAPDKDGWIDFVTKMSDCDQTTNPDGCYIDIDMLDTNPPTPYTTLFAPDSNQPITGVLVAPCGTNCPVVLFDDNYAKYGYTEGIQTRFTRTIHTANIVQNGENQELYVVSTITWPQGNKTESVSFSEYLFNWTAR